jgi:glycosyltransferase involved in cell wall biosynthesis
MHEPSLRVAAIMMVRNESHVILTCVGHLLTLGVERVYVVDNGSTDETPELLRNAAALTGRLVLSTDHGEFRQDEVLTALARRAAAEGADWILPVDADEFLWLRPGVSLLQLCRRSGIGGYRVPVRNFLQARPVRRDWPSSLMTMCVAAVPSGEVIDGQAMVTAGEIPFTRVRYPTKLLVRASPSLQLTFGHHDAMGLTEPLVALADGEILHAPMRAAQDLHHRVEAGRRVMAVTPHATQNWHLKRLVGMGPDELAREWHRNSFHPLRPLAAGAGRLDWRLSRIAIRQVGFRRRVYRSRIHAP